MCHILVCVRHPHIGVSPMFHQVLDLACVESRAAYEKTKASRASPSIADVAGNSVRRIIRKFSNLLRLSGANFSFFLKLQFRPCAADTYSSIISGECADLFKDVMTCNAKNEYNYGIKCKQVRSALEECAAKNKYGEFGKSY